MNVAKQSSCFELKIVHRQQCLREKVNHALASSIRYIDSVAMLSRKENDQLCQSNANCIHSPDCKHSAI